MFTLRDRTALALLGEVGSALGPGALRDLTDCVAMLDREGRITQLSRGSLLAMELTSDRDLIGSDWLDLWPKDARVPLEEALARSADGHITKYWAPFVHLDGSVSQWDIRLSPVRDAASEVTSVIAVSRRMMPH
ncbi:MAG: PAS domain-containing protein [Pseudomonadota bacterium]